MIRVQREDFDPAAEVERLVAGNHEIGGVVTFTGLVRDVAEGRSLRAMTLEHYPGMTEKMLGEIEAEANKRWPLMASLIVHRYGALKPGERIVLVAVASAHRQAAFEACAFLVDWLKTRAPFWKLEETDAGAQWVAARASDDAAAHRWTAADNKAAE
jgi:molybdopterin synthase catalytic subunit